MGSPVKRKAETTRQQALGAVITGLRLKKGLIGLAVAQRVGCNQSHMNEIETWKAKPHI